MRKAQEIFFKYARFSTSNTQFWNLNITSAEQAIEDAQKEAWNEAIESASLEVDNHFKVTKKDILKLKK